MSRIDIRRIIASKNPVLAGLLPGIFLRRFEGLIHLHEINRVLSRFENKTGAAFIQEALEYLNVHVRIHGEEYLRPLERPVLVSNHPLGGLDGLVLLSVLSRNFENTKLMVNDFLMNISQLRELFVPVNKLGSNRENREYYRELFSSNAAILHFPAGLCSRRKGGSLRDLPWNGSYVRLCRDNSRPIVPCFFAGENSRFFYTLANLRRWFHIGFNIEMILLVDEMFRQRGRTMEVWIGRAISPDRLRGDTRSINAEIRRRVYALPGKFRQVEGRHSP